jgi:S1-C subfamily serine protease
VGLVAGVALAPRVASRLTNDAGLEGAVIALVVVVLGLSVGQVVGFLVGQRSGALARKARLGALDAALGSVFGIGVTLVSYWLIGSLLSTGPVPEISRQLRRSDMLRAMTGVARPPDVLAYVRQYLDASVFPPVFAGPPRMSGPVPLPPPGVARAAYRAAGPSTVHVSVEACGGNQLGSGWIAAPEAVVTNAHVVAGGADVTITTRAGSSRRGTVVLFDAAEDVAVVRVEGLEGPVLELEQRPLERGTAGATLGYPGADGESLKVHRAAVRARFTPTGYDIYSRDTVRREIYELRARVRQGDSGGPFVTRKGRVAGVVFAASTADPNTGYALTASQVVDEVQRGNGATAAVGTGRCTH